MNTLLIYANLKGNLFNNNPSVVQMKGNMTGTIVHGGSVDTTTVMTGTFMDTPVPLSLPIFNIPNGSFYMNGTVLRTPVLASTVSGTGYVEINGTYESAIGLDTNGNKGLVALSAGKLRVNGRLSNTLNDAAANCVHKTGGTLISDGCVYKITNVGANAVYATTPQNVKTYMLSTNDENGNPNLTELITGAIYIIDADVE